MVALQAFGRWYAPGSTPLPSEDLSAHMYRRASTVLRQHGFGHYEVSNYAKTGRQAEQPSLLPSLPFLLAS